jgi:hypothetical protein
MATTTALSSLSSDLAFSVSFSIGAEFLASAKEAELSEDELVAAVLVVVVLLSALPKTAQHVVYELRKRKLVPVGAGGMQGVVAFASLVTSIVQKIALSLAVQLLANNVRSRQQDRAVRIISLVSVVIFFLFLEATSSTAKRSS